MELSTLRHSVSHIMAEAVCDLFPGTKLGIGPSIEEGFYYDFDRSEPFVPEDLVRIEKRMQEIVKDNSKFVKEDLTKSDAVAFFEKLGQNYKVELIKELPGESVTIYKHGKFSDLCKGPHINATGEVKAFKLLSIAGAYWRGSEKNPMLQRIYGTAFFSEEDLKSYLAMLSEAEKRDHRKLGRDLDLFSLQEEAGPGLVFWHPKGALVRSMIETYWRAQHLASGYELVYTPHIAKQDLWKTSGHTDFFTENMYKPMDVDEVPYLIKPMNCPFHLLIYKSRKRSYRELPIRWAELGTVYRYERSGVLHGLMRVRGFTQDDAHIICTREQLDYETKRVLTFVLNMLKDFGFTQYDIYLSTRPETYVGQPEVWDEATNALKSALQSAGLPFKIDEGGGAFYGPKIDVKIKDAIGRVWQCSTIQVDFNEPERFDITYVGQDNQNHRPIMIHRALLGSIERFMGVLIEHYAGEFPIWLAPVQAKIIPIAERHQKFVEELENALKVKGIRAEADFRNEKMQYKIREAEVTKVPYMIVIGDKEVSSNAISVRSKRNGDLGSMNINDFIKRVKEEASKKS